MKANLKHTFFLSAFLLLAMTGSVKAQEKPPIPLKVEVNTSRNLNFGSFTVDVTGGTVSVDYNSVRSSTGGVYELPMGASPSAALFDVTANPGTIVQISAPANIPLTGSNGGTIYLNIGSYSTGQMFITTANPPDVNSVSVGGTLTIPANTNNLPGEYNGTFTLTFIHQ